MGVLCMYGVYKLLALQVKVVPLAIRVFVAWPSHCNVVVQRQLLVWFSLSNVETDMSVALSLYNLVVQQET